MDKKTTISIAKINRMRRQAEKIREVVDDIDTPGWSKSDFDAMQLLYVFPQLRLKEEFSLVSYLYRSGGNGNGIIYAVPKSVPTIEEKPGEQFFDPPKPLSALDDIMEAIEGDGTPYSYFCASLFFREAEEFGARWHGVNWGTHTMLFKEPWDPTPSHHFRISVPSFSEWKWLQEEPEQWKPVVIQDNNTVKVIFYTYSGYNRETIYKHVDLYNVGSYCFASREEIIATGEAGFLF